MRDCIKVFGVSLGSSQRDFAAEVKLAGWTFRVERAGVDGQLGEALKMVRHLDGKVDAIGLGGVNLNYRIGKRSYPIREGQVLARACLLTPVVDGGFVKEFWEPALVRSLVAGGSLELKGKRVLVTSVLDRYPLAVCMEELGAQVKAGDALLALKLPIIFPTVHSFAAAARLTMPLLSRVPLKYLYPLGKKQEEKQVGWDNLLRGINIIAGDFPLINRYLPRDLSGKIILTSTLTPEDRIELKHRGAERIIALGITLGERSLGANLLDGIITAAANKTVFGQGDKQKVANILLQRTLKNS